MIIRHLFLLCICSCSFIIQSQNYIAGFKSLQLIDSTRTYKPNTKSNDKLHFRPVDLDIWYPSNETSANPMLFKDLFRLLEQRATNYQDNGNFSGATEELAQFYVSELGIGVDAKKLLNIKTNTYPKLTPTKTKHPLILYMAGFNGMGFENYKILEKLAENGYIVVSIWSVGRYPGNMTNQIYDMLEQVYDAEFAIDYLKHQKNIIPDFDNIGVLGCSWGGMSSAVFAKRNPITKAFVSLDGSETHYFGESEKDNSFIQEIYDQKLLIPTSEKFDYLYLESGDKLNQFKLKSIFNYYNKIQNSKQYLRFTNSQHNDFTSLPSILKSTETAIETHSNITSLTLSFFNKSLQKNNEFNDLWQKISTLKNTSTQPFELRYQAEKIKEIYGLILDKENNTPIPYVNIGITNTEVGTVSNTKGNFFLKLNEKLQIDTLRISSIGFKTIKIPIKNLIETKAPITLKLDKDIKELNEVILSKKTLKKKILGNKTESKFLSHLFEYGQLGKELGIKININKKPTYIDQFNFHIAYNRFHSKTLFRLNMYSLKKGQPDKNIITDNIIIPVNAKQTGMISVDLRAFNIIATEDVLVTLEWIDSEGEIHKNEAIQISLGLMTGGTYERKSKQAPMKKLFRGMGLGYTLNVRQ